MNGSSVHVIPTLAVVFILAASSPARAAQQGGVSTISIGPAHFLGMGLEMTLLQGERPSYLDSGYGGSFTQWGLCFRGRGGATLGKTRLGAQVGVEYDLRLGYVSDETELSGDRKNFAFSFKMGMPVRVLTFNRPRPGMLVVHIDAEVGTANARWWSDGARFGIMGGLRLAMRLLRQWRLELDYTLLPFVVTATRNNAQVRRLEHRWQLTTGIGPLGLGVQLMLSRDRTRPDASAAYTRTSDRSLGILLEYRGLKP